MAEIDSLPPYSTDLLDHLQEVFPPLSPRPDRDSAERIWFRAGARSVIEYLEQLKAQGEENILE